MRSTCYLVTVWTTNAHTLHYNYDNVLIRKLLHVSGLTGPSSGTAQFYKIIVQPCCNPQYVELSHVRQCISRGVGMCTVNGTACRFQCAHREQTYGLFHLLCTYPSSYSYTDERVTILYILRMTEELDDCFIQLCSPWRWSRKARNM